MCVDTIVKIELLLAPKSNIMELLIKAKHFLEHAIIHAQTGNSFDSMIAIHSLDNSIEDSETFDSVNAKGVYSSRLIDILGLNDKHRET